MVKLNVGCNDVIFPDWINIDIYEHAGAIQHDARQKFPYEDKAVDFIFSEHFIEHLNETESLFYFKECYRMLKPGGVVRTATFCIDNLAYHCSTDERWAEYSKWLYSGLFMNKTRTEFLNFAIYEAGGHKYMWNNDEMIRYLKEAGFVHFHTPAIKESSRPELCNLEYRCNSDCIVEAIR